MSATLGCQRKQTACGRLHVLYITAGLLLLTIFISSRLWSSNAGHLSARKNQLHQFSRQAATEVKLPYHKTPEQCYYRADRTHTVVVTILLPNKPGDVKVIASGSLERLLQSTPADVVLFHTGWSQLDVEKHIRKTVSFPFEARCIANVDWSTGHDAGSWEAVETGYHGAGYRSMCRWYARRVGMCVCVGGCVVCGAAAAAWHAHAHSSSTRQLVSNLCCCSGKAINQQYAGQ